LNWFKAGTALATDSAGVPRQAGRMSLPRVAGPAFA
jgi:hypothetical protein